MRDQIGLIPKLLCQGSGIEFTGVKIANLSARQSSQAGVEFTSAHTLLQSRPGSPRAGRPLKNYLRWQYCVKNRLGCEPSRNAHLQLVKSDATPVASSPVFALSCLPRLRFSTAC